MASRAQAAIRARRPTRPSFCRKNIHSDCVRSTPHPRLKPCALSPHAPPNASWSSGAAMGRAAQFDALYFVMCCACGLINSLFSLVFVNVRKREDSYPICQMSSMRCGLVQVVRLLALCAAPFLGALMCVAIFRVFYFDGGNSTGNRRSRPIISWAIYLIWGTTISP